MNLIVASLLALIALPLLVGLWVMLRMIRNRNVHLAAQTPEPTLEDLSHIFRTK